ncbi:MAG: putative selenium-dependent hydroxylase accessory protein YqeC [Anaerolineales bacterium]|nr:putative selenium-dependent hydroxylase accessory protein YqeC [Anaerolineales bacterium]
MILTLAQALRTSQTDCIAFIGSGGKTTALFQLAKQMTPPVVIAVAAHLGIWQTSLASKHIVARSSNDLIDLKNALSDVTLITGEIEGDRAASVSDETLKTLHQFCAQRSIPLLLEADGSRQRPLKGWAAHEPPIPNFTNHVVAVAGLSGLGKPLNAEFVHRPEAFERISGVKSGEIVDAHALTRALLHAQSGVKNIPPSARKTILLNQADTPELQANAKTMAKKLRSAYHATVIASMKQNEIYAAYESTAGIILAAGEAARYGQPKQLLDWNGEPFIRVVVKRALEAGLSPVVVVTGANAEQVEAPIGDLNVTLARNNEWQSGQSASVKAGIRTLHTTDPNAGAAIFLLVDQPQITVSILQALAEKHAEGLYSAVVPLAMGRRANPVLFDRRTFADLLTLEGDTGGRAILHKRRVEFLPWHDERLLLDVDTPEHYQRLLASEGR